MDITLRRVASAVAVLVFTISSGVAANALAPPRTRAAAAQGDTARHVEAAARAAGFGIEVAARPVGSDPVAGLVDAAIAADSLRREAVAGVSPADWAAAQQAFAAVPSLLQQNDGRVAFDQESLTTINQGVARLAAIDQAKMWKATLVLAAAVDDVVRAFDSGVSFTTAVHPTPLGDVVVDADPVPCNSSYSKAALAIIDTCGNDYYSAPAGGADGSAEDDPNQLDLTPIAIVIDLVGDDAASASNSVPTVGAATKGGIGILVDRAGNDRWGTGGGALVGGAGYLGAIGVSIDEEGDDRYNAGGFLAPGGKYGSGLFAGQGVLVDVSGDDAYSGDTFQQGSGWFGNAFGLLADLAGNDTYHDISTYAQGSGGVGGTGLIIDSAGDDHYVAGSVFEQGAAACGGIGLLLDTSGADVYDEPAGYSQGHGANGLAATGCGDEAGKGLADRLLELLPPAARELVPGDVSEGFNELPIGAVGAMVDLGGDDKYNGATFALGSHIGNSAGLLIDAGGDDAYRAYDCAQGFGGTTTDAGYGCASIPSSPGIAALVDASGDDTYSLNSFGDGEQGQGVGYGGSTVVLLDGNGVDKYSGDVVDGGGVQPRGETGVAIDLLPASDQPGPDPTDDVVPEQIAGTAEWAVGNAEWVVGNAEWLADSAKWATDNADWVTGNAEWLIGTLPVPLP